jgi:pyruvate formate lyase activating enzyme
MTKDHENCVNVDHNLREAGYYQMAPSGKASCRLCPQNCQIVAEKTGFCKIRRLENGRLMTVNFGRISSMAVDPIEKKPLYHYYPGKTILSVGTIGCNLACEFCQNWQISREGDMTLSRIQVVTPEELTEIAVRAHEETGSIGLAYTYSEPGVWFEFLEATMPLVREQGLKNVLVTNAFLNPEPWNDLLEWTDAANIDLKGFRDEYYRKLCHGKLSPVLANIETAAAKIHVELTTLLIPGENDSPEQIREQARWIASLNPEIPLHLSRYFPNYKLDKQATPVATLIQSYEIAREYLRFVYIGNAGGASDTRCPDCGSTWIERNGYRTKALVTDQCPECGRRTGLKSEL